MQKPEPRIYFKGIDSLRFYAALAVIVTHIELLKGSFGLKSYWKDPLFFNLGGLGVYFFFVLSGFLITYLLLAEREKTGRISIRKFYLRRILRIWPLYYFVVLLGFFVLPQFDLFRIGYLQPAFEENFTVNLILYLLILPNLAFSLYPAVPNIGQTWSIGVEEQFYIFWPLLISRSKSIVKTLIITIFILILVKVCVLVLGRFYQNTSWYRPLKLFVAMSKFECMAIGGLGAYFLYRNHSGILKVLYHPLTFALSIGLSIALIYLTPPGLQDGVHLVYAVLFLQIIVFVTNRPRTLFLDSKVISYLGRISYGIYMYHFMVIPFCLYLYTRYWKSESGIVQNCSIYLSVIALTIAVSAASYRFLEKRFIDLKQRFSLIRSGS